MNQTTNQFSNGSARNLRFWVLISDSLVKLTLKPDQVLTWGKFSKDDEGWSAASETWTHVGSGVVLDWRTDGRDCDGRVSETGSCFCPADRLAARVVDCAEPSVPDWQPTIENLRRDYSAELANY